MQKSSRYVGSTGEGLVLLLYVTDNSLFPSETFVNCLRAFTRDQEHSFDEIHLVKPSVPEGVHWKIYPATELIPDSFDPEKVKGNVVQNLRLSQ